MESFWLGETFVSEAMVPIYFENAVAFTLLLVRLAPLQEVLLHELQIKVQCTNYLHPYL